jgi:hypothetical protein
MIHAPLSRTMRTSVCRIWHPTTFLSTAVGPKGRTLCFPCWLTGANNDSYRMKTQSSRSTRVGNGSVHDIQPAVSGSSPSARRIRYNAIPPPHTLYDTETRV